MITAKTSPTSGPTTTPLGSPTPWLLRSHNTSVYVFCTCELVADIGRIESASATYQPLAVNPTAAASGAMVAGGLRNYCCHLCRIVLPNSYAPGDGRAVAAAARAPTKGEADEEACLAVFAFLRADRAGLPHVLLRPAHWNVSIEALLEDIGRIAEPRLRYQPLAVNQRAAASGAMAAGGLQNVPEANLERAADAIRLCLRAHGGEFAPSMIEHTKIVATGVPQEKIHGWSARGQIPSSTSMKRKGSCIKRKGSSLQPLARFLPLSLEAYKRTAIACPLQLLARLLLQFLARLPKFQSPQLLLFGPRMN